MTWLWLVIGVCIIIALVLVLALCKVSGAYDEHECEDYLKGHYEQVDSWDRKNAIREGGFLSDEDEGYDLEDITCIARNLDDMRKWLDESRE